ncbi:MAG: hypothetical protein ACHBN1_35280 [Heteroscytonema crispum UTEX LB 1556]
MGRPQDRSGSPTKGAPSPTTNYQLNDYNFTASIMLTSQGVE